MKNEIPTTMLKSMENKNVKRTNFIQQKQFKEEEFEGEDEEENEY